MKVLTIQSLELDANKRVYPDISKCNHPDALEVYKRLFNDYNQKKGANYSAFFWGFSKLLTDDLDEAIERAREMTGTYDGKIIILDVPDELCLETDFYNFSDEIFAYNYPDELDSYWKSIYEERNAERQVIFPYIDPTMIIKTIN